MKKSRIICSITTLLLVLALLVSACEPFKVKKVVKVTAEPTAESTFAPDETKAPDDGPSESETSDVTGGEDDPITTPGPETSDPVNPGETTGAPIEETEDPGYVTNDPSEPAETQAPDITKAPGQTETTVPQTTGASKTTSTVTSSTAKPQTGTPSKTATPTVTAKATATPKVTAKVTATPKVTAKPGTDYVITYDSNCLISRDYIRIGGSLDIIEPGHGTDNYTFMMKDNYTGKKLGLWGWYATTMGKIESFGYAIDNGPINYSTTYKIAVSSDVTAAANKQLGSGNYTGYFDINPVIKDAKTHTYEVFAKIGTKNVHIWTVTTKEYSVPATPIPTAKPGGNTTYTDTFVNDSTANNQQNSGKFKISYSTTSHVFIGSKIKLNASYTKTAGGSLTPTFKSLTTGVATCDTSGNVTGVKMGLATIRASVSNGDFIDFYVTVVPKDLTYPLYVALNANNANAFVRKSLNIGGGYYRDIYGSISKIIYNDPLMVNSTYNATADANLAAGKGGGPLGGFKMEFITVHYTGNMGVGAKASNNASYFASCPSDLTVHFVTGNDGVFKVGSPELYHVNSTGDRALGTPITWISTGVAAPMSGEITPPSIHISSDGYFTINGKKSTYKVPARNSRWFVAGTYVKPDTIAITGDTFKYSNGSTYPVITNLGIPWKIEDGEYLLAQTYWNGTQQSGGRLCSLGGDYNSVAIESAVNEDSELWYTWNKTAQLVGHLMIQFKLDKYRVVGHNTWTSKMCPQPMIENNNEIWDIFVEMCDAEREKLACGGNYTMKILKGSEVVSQSTKDRSLASQNGTYTVKQGAGVVVPDSKAHVVLYEVTVVTNGKTEKIKLACAVNPK